MSRGVNAEEIVRQIRREYATLRTLHHGRNAGRNAATTKAIDHHRFAIARLACLLGGNTGSNSLPSLLVEEDDLRTRILLSERQGVDRPELQARLRQVHRRTRDMADIQTRRIS